MKYLFLVVAFLCSTLAVSAQKGERGAVRGNVYDQADATPLSFATVQLEGANIGTTTDINGFFSVANLAAGKYRLKVTYVGYNDYTADFEIKKNEIQFLNVYLTETGNQLGEVVVSGKKEQARAEVQVSKLTVTPKQIRSLPSTGGQADVAQYLTVLPGVVFTGDQGGQLYIRGGSPVQNRIMLDGMTIYNPFHSVGFYSVFETELIRNVDVLTGGFNSDHGGRISAVVDVKTREGNRKRFSGMVSGSPFMAKALVEGPIIPLKENGGSISFVLTAKQSLINQTDKQLYPYVGDTTKILGLFNQSDLWLKSNRVNPNEGIPFDFTDLYGKITLMTNNGSKFNVFGFNFTDRVDYSITDFGWDSRGGGMDFTIVPANSNTIISGMLSGSGYEARIEEADRLPRNSSINGFQGVLNFVNLGRDNEFRYGLELSGFSTKFSFVNFLGFIQQENTNNTEIAGYMRWKLKKGPLVIEPGLRLQYYQSLDQKSLEPRFGMKYNISDRLRFKAAGGLYSQNLLSTVNERDIVNLFVGFLSSPSEAIQVPNSNERTNDKLQRSIHGVAGFEVDLTDNFDLNIEGYYKDFTQLISLNRFKKDLDDSNYFIETGEAYGVDLSLKWEGKRAYVWGAYSLGYVRRDDGIQVYPPVFDRRHNLNVVSTYQAGKNKEWEFGARWNFGSGFPFTLTQGFYTNFTFGDGIGTDVYTGNPDVGILYAEKRNGGRLPYYHRLDLSIKRVFKFSKYSSLEVTASATNSYNRPNIFYFDRVRYERVNQLPILPSLSATFQF